MPPPALVAIDFEAADHERDIACARALVRMQGTIDRANGYPRRVIEAALLRGAAAVVLAHNHPNAHLTPSEHVKLLTRAIVLAAETVHLKVVDHLIVSAQDTFSFRKAGLL